MSESRATYTTGDGLVLTEIPGTTVWCCFVCEQPAETRVFHSGPTGDGTPYCAAHNPFSTSHTPEPAPAPQPHLCQGCGAICEGG